MTVVLNLHRGVETGDGGKLQYVLRNLASS